MTLNWTNFTCPSGTGTLSGYNVTITNATFADGSTARAFDPGTRTAEITLGEGGLQATATYTATCSGDGGQRESGPSPQMSVPITPEATETPEDEGELPEG